MPNCPLTLRTLKGSRLTFAELDSNFLSLQSCINQISNSVSTNFLPLSGGSLTGALSACTGGIYTNDLYSCSNMVTVWSDVTIEGNVVINGSATTINTEVIRSEDNNIILNYSGNTASAEGGGITVAEAQGVGIDSLLYVDSNGCWHADPGFCDLTIDGVTFTAQTPYVFVDDGSLNSITTRYAGNNITSSDYSNIGGGYNNTVSGDYSSIAGGKNNTASGLSFIGGGIGNSITGNSFNSSVVGGDRNTINGTYSFIGGGRLNSVQGEGLGFIVGGRGNLVNGYVSSITAGRQNEVRGFFSSIIGGKDNLITNNGDYSFIGNGNNNENSGSFSSIIGGIGNNISNTGTYSFIGGGIYNNILRNGSGSFIGSGSFNKISGSTSSIVGGAGNAIGISGGYSLIGGGFGNTISDRYSFIGGGYNNTINSSNYSSIIGGQSNTINDPHTNSHIIGSNITSVSANTTHVERLNIKTANTGSTSTEVLVLESNGMVNTSPISTITGGLSGKYVEVITGYTANVTQTITHNLGTGDEVVVDVIDTTNNERIGVVIDNYQTNALDLTLSQNYTSIKIVIIG